MRKFWLILLFVYAYAAVAFVSTNFIAKRDQQFIGHEIFLELNSQYPYSFQVQTQDGVNMDVKITVQGRLNTHTEENLQLLVGEYVGSVEYDKGNIAIMMNRIYEVLRKNDYKIMNIHLGL